MIIDSNASPSKYFYRHGLPAMTERVASTDGAADTFDIFLQNCDAKCSFYGGSYDQVGTKIPMHAIK